MKQSPCGSSVVTIGAAYSGLHHSTTLELTLALFCSLSFLDDPFLETIGGSGGVLRVDEMT
jgi:hypothetical protein